MHQAIGVAQRVGALVFSLGCFQATLAQPYPHVVETEPLSPAQQREKFRLPPGFEIELVAAEPQIAKPMNLNFDARGPAAGHAVGRVSDRSRRQTGRRRGESAGR